MKILALSFYLSITALIFTNYLTNLEDIQIFDDGKDFQNNLITAIIVTIISVFWIIFISISFYIQSKDEKKLKF